MSAVQQSQYPPGSQPRTPESRTGFVSPTRLQELRQSTMPTHNFPSRHQQSPSAPGVMQQQQQSQPQQRPNARPASQGQPSPTHNRTSSFFSSFRKNSTPQEPNASVTSINQPPNTSLHTKAQPPAPNTVEPISSPQTQAQPQPSQATPLTRVASNDTGLHPEIRSVVNLNVAHARKIYFSGPLIRRIERQPDGQRPSKDEGWTDVWAQLGGTTLSVWDMKRITEASQQGKEVPPAYVNMTDAVSALPCL